MIIMSPTIARQRTPFNAVNLCESRQGGAQRPGSFKSHPYVETVFAAHHKYSTTQLSYTFERGIRVGRLRGL